MDNKLNAELFDFIAASPTAWHTAENVAQRLSAQGYSELFESEDWALTVPGKYFVRRNGSSLIAFRLPQAEHRGFMIMAAHGDSPCFKIKENGQTEAAGIYKQLNTEKYGGMLCASWLDRPLSAAGRLIVREGGALEQRLVNIDRDLLLIPSLAIHMDKNANEGKKYDPNVDMQPLLGDLSGESGFMELIAREAGVQAESVVSSDLFLYCRTPGTVWGADGEYISAPRLDDLQCVFACMKGFLDAGEAESVPALCVFDNEEVGSGTKQGADSDFLSRTLQNIWEALGRSPASYRRALAQSLMVSADNAHAVHPNHPEYADRKDRPRMNGGIVIKYNANQRYTTDAASAALFRELCGRAGAPVQSFSNRADLPGGSTLGNISSSHVSIDAVDLGLAQLAMHSACETAGAMDTGHLRRAAAEFYSSSLRRTGKTVEILKGKSGN